MGPSSAGFLAFLRTYVGIPAIILPDADPVIPLAYSTALSIVNTALACAGPAGSFGVDPTQPTQYALAVYNLAADRVINFAQDQTGRTDLQDLRLAFKIGMFVPGVVASSGDAGTNTSLATPDFMKMFTLRDLQNLKTPYGRAYLEIAQDYGPSVWGVS